MFQLANGELRTHPWAMDGYFNENTVNKVVAAINTAITEVYTRFPLLTKELVLLQHSGLTEYLLEPRFAVTDPTEVPIKYIDDSKYEPFTGNLLRIEAVYDEIGDELAMNNTHSCKVFFTPAPNIIEIPNPVDTNALFVTYRTRPPLVTKDTTYLDIPAQALPLIMAYVGFRAYAASSDQNQAQLSMVNYQKYELMCANLTVKGMDNEYNTTNPNCKAERRGWV
ncbi:MAG: hypothetical protein ACRCR2_02220 [Fusobacteriaceae bacterium]